MYTHKTQRSHEPLAQRKQTWDKRIWLFVPWGTEQTIGWPKPAALDPYNRFQWQCFPLFSSKMGPISRHILSTGTNKIWLWVPMGPKIPHPQLLLCCSVLTVWDELSSTTGSILLVWKVAYGTTHISIPPVLHVTYASISQWQKWKCDWRRQEQSLLFAPNTYRFQEKSNVA
jgi:hypothetical protein